MKVAAYLRVSTSDQSTDNQLPALQAWCDSRGYELVMVYSENESAWKSGHQKELARLLDDCRNGRRKFDVVLCWSLDRLSREGPAAILNLVNGFAVHRVRVVSLQEPWTETVGPMTELLLSIAGWVAKMESERRSERTKAGLLRAMASGKTLGRPPGARDKQKRRKSGYHNRWSKTRG